MGWRSMIFCECNIVDKVAITEERLKKKIEELKEKDLETNVKDNEELTNPTKLEMIRKESEEVRKLLAKHDKEWEHWKYHQNYLRYKKRFIDIAIIFVALNVVYFLVSEKRNSYGNLRLSDWFNRPAILEQGDNFDELTRGLATQPELASDAYHDSEITQFLFRDGQPFGQDLKAICVQRNRDHGLASYNDYRSFCGLPKAHTFEDFLDVISKENVQKLSTLYEHPDDVDLTVGGSLEVLVPGTLAGPTFLCILTEQFYRTRVGDRFWFENGGETGFTLPQLNELRKASISRLMCDNGKNIRAMQPRGFERISHSNAVLPCEALPVVDLSLWKDVGGGQYQERIPDSDYYFKK